MAHGSARLTQDIDIVYSREKENITRLLRALEPYAPYLRGAPAGRPRDLDAIAELEIILEERDQKR